WLRDIDGAWLAEVAGGAQIVTLDNHYVTGGQGDAVLAEVAAEAPEAASRVQKIGVTEVPKSGGNDETLRAHGLDAGGIRRPGLERAAVDSPARGARDPPR